MKDAQNNIDGGCEQRESCETMIKQNKKQKKHTQNQILKVLNCKTFMGERISGEFDIENVLSETESYRVTYLRIVCI